MPDQNSDPPWGRSEYSNLLLGRSEFQSALGGIGSSLGSNLPGTPYKRTSCCVGTNRNHSSGLWTIHWLCPPLFCGTVTFFIEIGQEKIEYVPSVIFLLLEMNFIFFSNAPVPCFWNKMNECVSGNVCWIIEDGCDVHYGFFYIVSCGYICL